MTDFLLAGLSCPECGKEPLRLFTPQVDIGTLLIQCDHCHMARKYIVNED